jgi:hypothetical protein
METPLAPDLAFAVAQFELLGATLRAFCRWYPLDERVRDAFAET